MTFQEPAGLWLLLFLPLFLWAFLSVLRRRRIVSPAFDILAGLIDALPKIPKSHNRRRLIQKILILSGVLLLSLSAGGLVIGSAEDRPYRLVVILDHLVRWQDTAGKPAGWQETIAAVEDLAGELRPDDRVFLLRTDFQRSPEGALSPRKMVRSVRAMAPSDLPLHRERLAGRIQLLRQSAAPDAIVLVTPFPERWEGLPLRAGGALEIKRTTGPATGRNAGIYDAEVRPDLLRPNVIDVFCRFGVHGPSDDSEGLEELKLLLLDGERPIAEHSAAVAAGESAGVFFPGIAVQGRELKLKLLPDDHFADDNLFAVPVRSNAFLKARLFTSGNVPLEAALRAIPGLEVEKRDLAAGFGRKEATISIADNFAPADMEGSLLSVRPPDALPGFTMSGAVSRPRIVQVASPHPVLAGVNFGSLQVERLPILAPSPSLASLVTADGYPLILAGRGPGGSRMAVIAFDPLESGWSYDPSYPILIANIVSWLGEEGPGAPRALRVGSGLPADLLSNTGHLRDPLGRKIGRDDLAGYTLPLPGLYTLGGGGGRGSIRVNLLNEEVSRSMAATEVASAGKEVFTPELPLRLEMGYPLLLAALLLLAAEILVAPPDIVGRYEE